MEEQRPERAIPQNFIEDIVFQVGQGPDIAVIPVCRSSSVNIVFLLRANRSDCDRNASGKMLLVRKGSLSAQKIIEFVVPIPFEVEVAQGEPADTLQTRPDWVL